MKNRLKYGFLSLGITLAINSCGSNQSEKRAADSIERANDSIQNDTSSFDITSQRDSTENSQDTSLVGF